MDFVRRAAAWLAGGVLFAGSAVSVWAAAACLPERAILQQGLLAMQSPAAAAACAMPRPVPKPTPTAAPVQPTPAPTAAPTPTAAPSPTPTPVPSTAPEIEDAGAIRAEQFRHGRGESSITLEAGSIRNSTANADADLRAAVSTENLPFTIELNSDEPQVLILHTHATETYQPDGNLWFDKAFAARTNDRSRNMCAVGAAMARVLNEAGIITLHDETLHDSPSYTESYARSAETAKAYLAQYPSIKIILDVHRDALGDENTRIKPLCTLEGQNTAQIMLIAGCDNGGSVSLPRWRENLAFAAAWEAQMEGSFPGLTRPVLCGYRFYNQGLTTGSLLVEVGGHGNTLEEALRAGEYAAQALAALLLQ